MVVITSDVADIVNGFHKAGVVVDSPQATVILKRIVDSFTLYDVSLSTGGVGDIILMHMILSYE